MNSTDKITVNLDYKRPKYVIMIDRAIFFIVLAACIYFGAESVILSVLTVILFIVVGLVLVVQMHESINKNKRKFNNKKEFMEWANNLEDWN